MKVLRPIDDRLAFDTKYPGLRAQVLSQFESAVFFAAVVQEGGRGEALHYHSSDQAYFMLHGDMTVRLGDEERHIGPKTFVHIPAGVAHCNWNDGPGAETHIELVFPAPPTGSPVATTVDSPSDVPLEHRSAEAAGTVETVDPGRMRDVVAGVRAQTLLDRRVGSASTLVSYVELATDHPPQHTRISEFDRYYFVVEGELTAEVALQRYVAGPETLVVVPAGVPHRLWNAADGPETHLEVYLPAPTDGMALGHDVDVVPTSTVSGGVATVAR